MSGVGQLDNNLTNLPDVLAQYDLALNEAPQHLSLVGKTIEQANRDQAQWPVYYDHKRAELDILCKYISSKVDAKRGELYRKFTEIHTRELSDRAKDKYIDNEPEYLIVYQLYLEVLEVYEKFKAIVDAFQTRGYALKNINDARVHMFNSSVL